MRSTRAIAALLILPTIMILTLAGCSSDNAIAPKGTYVPDFDRLNATLDDLVRSYEERNIELFASILDDDYTWIMAAYQPIPDPPETLDRTTECLVTEAIFDNAVRLELVLNDFLGWRPLPYVQFEPCDGCWSVGKIYEIMVQLENQDVIYLASGTINFVLVPYRETPWSYEYRILRAADITDPFVSGSSVEWTTWSAIKKLFLN